MLKIPTNLPLSHISTTLCVLHNDAYLFACRLVYLFQLHDIGVVEHAVELSLPEGDLFLFGPKVADIDSFHDV
jgi:hypothetical protein